MQRKLKTYRYLLAALLLWAFSVSSAVASSSTPLPSAWNETPTLSEDVYPTYDEYNAINVERVQDIPMDYPGIMGVPITIINKYNPEQFEIVGEANHGSDNEFDLFKPIRDYFIGLF